MNNETNTSNTSGLKVAPPPGRTNLRTRVFKIQEAMRNDPRQFYSWWVGKFHKDILKAKHPRTPQLPVNKENNVRMLIEEFGELMLGLGVSVEISVLEGAVKPNLVDIVDGAGDLIYVLHGLLLSCGIMPELVLDEIAVANEEKVHDPSDPTKPVRKPEGWQEPRIAEILMLMGWKPN